MQENVADFTHRPVMLDEMIELLGPKYGEIFVDATLGLGGHSEAILEAASETKVIGIDQDREALRLASERLAKFGERFEAVYSNFADIADAVGERRVDGIIADLGVSSMQLDDWSRGFSFREDAPLDMRMDPDSGSPTAADLLAETDETDLANLIFRYGEERLSRRIAKRIVERRGTDQAIVTTRQLAELLERTVKRSPKDKIHPATRTFQALRIAVNNEIDIIESFIRSSIDLLKTGGVLAIITFHSLEDRIVKQAFRRLSGKCECPPRMPICRCGAVKLVEVLTKKPIVPAEAEQAENARSRSAKLRACRKLGS